MLCGRGLVDRCVDSGNEVSASSQLGKLRKLRIHYRLHGYRERSQCKYEASLRLRKRGGESFHTHSPFGVSKKTAGGLTGYVVGNSSLPQ